MTARWLSVVLARIRDLATQQRVHFTMKALRELAGLGIGLDEGDACDVLANLVASEFAERLRSKKTGEWMYVFKPGVGGVFVYLKVILRANCVVISFHEEEDRSHEEK